MSRLPGSFRDPSGFMFYRENELYRQVNRVYSEDYDHFITSGLYQALVGAELLLEHEEVPAPAQSQPEELYKILKPALVPFVSYPHEWCFSQLKDAALTTLRIQQFSLAHGMFLKDASAYNIQFVRGKPILIDTLSFARYREGEPWVAYRQFCQHFLAPLALMAHTDIRMNQLFRIFIDGIPLDLTASLLPLRTRFKPSLLAHIHLHAKSQKHFSDKALPARKRTVSATALRGLLENLQTAVGRLSWNRHNTEWANYYSDCSYSRQGTAHKKQLLARFLDEISPQTVWDFGGNIGLFSRIASSRGIDTVCFDIDPSAIEKNYAEMVKEGESCLLPLVLDLTNPSPAMGWQNRERSSLLERGPADAAFALALVHHLAISNNLPLEKVAEFFRSVCRWLIIEFVPKSDPQVQRLLLTRQDIFPSYTRESFERAFQTYFNLEGSEEIPDTTRVLYKMKNRSL